MKNVVSPTGRLTHTAPELMQLQSRMYRKDRVEGVFVNVDMSKVEDHCMKDAQVKGRGVTLTTYDDVEGVQVTRIDNAMFVKTPTMDLEAADKYVARERERHFRWYLDQVMPPYRHMPLREELLDGISHLALEAGVRHHKPQAFA